MSNPRVRKIADRIKVIVAEMLERRVKDPRLGFVTVTDVRVSGDTQQATVFYTVLGEDKDLDGTAVAPVDRDLPLTRFEDQPLQVVPYELRVGSAVDAAQLVVAAALHRTGQAVCQRTSQRPAVDRRDGRQQTTDRQRQDCHQRNPLHRSLTPLSTHPESFD